MLDHRDWKRPGGELGERDGIATFRKDKNRDPRKKTYADGSDQSECVERVKAQQEARKSDPRGHEGRPSRGFGDTRPARELPWLTSPAPDQVYRCFSVGQKKNFTSQICVINFFCNLPPVVPGLLGSSQLLSAKKDPF